MSKAYAVQKLIFGCLLVTGSICAGISNAETYPDKPVRIVVAFPPGQATDTIARNIAQQMSISTGQQFFVENKPGAAGIIGTTYVKNAKPDGYTLLFTSSGPLAINPALYKKIAYDPIKDFTPVGMAVTVPLFLAINPELPVNNLQELIGLVKAEPGKYSYGSGGTGITAHLAMEALKRATGMNIMHVPYNGSPAAMTDLIGGRVQVMLDSGPLMLPHYQAGRIKILGVTMKDRVSAEPFIPTIAEQGVEKFEAVAWTALFAPANTPRKIVDTLNYELNKAMRSSALIGPLSAAGSEPTTSTPEELTAFLENEIVKWGQAVEAAGVQPN